MRSLVLAHLVVLEKAVFIYCRQLFALELRCSEEFVVPSGNTA